MKIINNVIKKLKILLKIKTLKIVTNLKIIIFSTINNNKL